jgi:hypothetical protein
VLSVEPSELGIEEGVIDVRGAPAGDVEGVTVEGVIESTSVLD